MDTKKLNESMMVLKEALGDALISADIWIKGTGTSIAGFNGNPRATALFDQITKDIVKSLKSSGFPVLDKYYLINLADGKLVVVLNHGDYLWKMLVDGDKANLGLLLNIAIPDALKALDEAIAG